MSLVPPLYAAEVALKKTTVCVTGVTGYVAGAVVQRLLASGHTVHGTCRKPDAPIVRNLYKLEHAKDNLRLFKADLNVPEDFEEAVKGCEVVFHIASPFLLNVPSHEVEEKLLKPAVSGTENILNTVNKVPSVKTVVLTSSVAAMQSSPFEHGTDHVLTESDWNNNKKSPYPLSKKLAEEKAWEINKQQRRWKLVTINPGFVLGPSPTMPESSESVTLMRRILGGEMRVAGVNLGAGYVDVRDVAAAHCLAMATPAAQGRYICVGGEGHFHDIASAASKATGRRLHPRFFVPKAIVWAVAPLIGVEREVISGWVNTSPKYNTSKIRQELGLQFTPLQDSVTDMIKALP